MVTMASKRTKTRRNVLLITVCIGAIVLVAFIAYDRLKPLHWESAIRAFEKMDAEHPPEQGGILFVGSSSIKMWKSLEQDFPSLPILNRGFGGSEMSDLIFFADRVILPYRPKLIVIYEGDNDIHSGKSPQRVLKNFQTLIQIIRDELPDSQIAFLSIKPSPSRRGKMDAMKQANVLIQGYAHSHEGVDYIDVFSPMLNAAGEPHPELFSDDRLHLNSAGYELWRQQIVDYFKNSGVIF